MAFGGLLDAGMVAWGGGTGHGGTGAAEMDPEAMVRRSMRAASSVGLGLVSAMALILAGPGRTPAAPPDHARRLPTPLPGWALELIAESSAVRHPSVACAPDGRVFVAEDPMDISSPKARRDRGPHPLPASRRAHHGLCRRNSTPCSGCSISKENFTCCTIRSSAFSPTTTAWDATASISSSRPIPKPGRSTGTTMFRRISGSAMDGYFYVAVGDKGLYGATGTRRRRVDLHGGGMVRLRPDGTGLEVFCHRRPQHPRCGDERRGRDVHLRQHRRASNGWAASRTWWKAAFTATRTISSRGGPTRFG